MTSVSAIYIILNSRDGKIYLGQAQDIKRRWQAHKRLLNSGKHTNRHLQRAWNKYGAQEFQFKILERCAIDQLDDREQHYLNVYIPKGICYNLSPSSRNTRGTVRSEETRQKLREARNRRPPPSEETKRKIGESGKGRIVTEETRRKIGEASKKRKHSEATRRKLSVSHMGKPSVNKGRKLTDEHRRKLSDAAKRREARKRTERDKSE